MLLWFSRPETSPSLSLETRDERAAAGVRNAQVFHVGWEWDVMIFMECLITMVIVSPLEVDLLRINQGVCNSLP